MILLPDITELSILGQMIQTLGVMGIALLFHLLFKVLPRSYFLWWVRAWLALSVALIALQLTYRLPSLYWLEFIYFLGKYLFAIFLWLGFASFPTGKFPAWNQLRWLLPLAIIWSGLLMIYPGNFSHHLRLHTWIFCIALLPAWITLLRMTLPIRYPWIKSFALTTLGLLILLFAANGLSLFSADNLSEKVATFYTAYQSIFDLIVQVMLAFSLLTIAAVNMKATLERANLVLQTERDNMTLLAHQDSLTGCFNRHALTELKTRFRQRHGIVVMIDIDNLKPINDQYGHHVGDQAICHVARVIKEATRTHDYLFRYGGDEFMLVCFELTVDDVERRLRAIQKRLLQSPVSDSLPCPVSVSWGASIFNNEKNFDENVEKADQQMYQRKLMTHQQKTT